MYHEPDHLHHNEDEDADAYADGIHGNRVIIYSLIAVAIMFLILTYILW